MATMNGVPFRKWLIPSSKQRLKSPYKMNPKKITLHNTDNQMPAQNEISYMRGNNNQTSYHVAVDEKEAIQGLSYYRNGWHSGDGGNGYGNRNTVAIEICRNYDRSRKTTNLNEPLKSQYSKAEQNAIKFVPQLCIDLGIVANNDNIKTHNDWNGKWCPRKILNEKRLQAVKNEIIKEYNRLKGNPASSGSKPSSSNKVDSHLTLNQVIDKTIAGGYKSEPERSKNIENKTNFSFKEVQSGVNKRLGSSVKPKPVKPKPVPSGKLVIDGRWGGATTSELQKAFGTYVDGIISRPSNVIKELQRLIGAVVDGYLGTETYRKLQIYLGTPVDGKLSKPSLMVKELQKRLNAGTIKKGKVNKPRGLRVGDTITTKSLYATAQSSKNVRSSSIKGYVADINNSRKNPIRLRSKKGGSYLGFTRTKDII